MILTQERLEGAVQEFEKQFGKDIVASALLDVTNETSIEKAFDADSAWLLVALISL